MTTGRHTPGPWVLGKPGRNGEDEHMCQVMTGYASGENDKSYDLICECRKVSSVRIPVAEKIANARLIAAPPDLLEALQKIADGPWPDEIDDPQKQAVWDAQIARAAITKAEGQS